MSTYKKYREALEQIAGLGGPAGAIASKAIAAPTPNKLSPKVVAERAAAKQERAKQFIIKWMLTRKRNVDILKKRLAGASYKNLWNEYKIHPTSIIVGCYDGARYLFVHKPKDYQELVVGTEFDISQEKTINNRYLRKASWAKIRNSGMNI